MEWGILGPSVANGHEQAGRDFRHFGNVMFTGCVVAIELRVFELRSFEMSAMSLATLMVFPAFMAYAAASDLVSMRISNRLTIGLVVAFCAFAIACQLPFEHLAWHVGAGAFMLVVCFALFAFGTIGGGDAKLAAATALWIGPELLMEYVLISSFAGGFLTLWILSMRDHPLPGFAANWTWLQRLHAPRNGVPYGIALALAGLFIFPQSEIWKSAVLIG